MLPFLKNKIKQESGISIKMRAPDQKDESEQEDNPDAAIEACAHDLINAIHNKDVKRAAQVLKDAFELLDSQPHVEGEHINEEEEQI